MHPDDKQLLGLLLAILGAALLIALLGYETLLWFEKPVGTLDNVVTFIIGTLAGSVTSGAGVGLVVSSRANTRVAELEAQLAAQTPPSPFDVISTHDRIEGSP